MLVLTSQKCIFRKHLLPSGELQEAALEDVDAVTRACWKHKKCFPVSCLDMSQRTINKMQFEFDIVQNILVTVISYLLCIQNYWKCTKHFWKGHLSNVIFPCMNILAHGSHEKETQKETRGMIWNVQCQKQVIGRDLGGWRIWVRKFWGRDGLNHARRQ